MRRNLEDMGIELEARRKKMAQFDAAIADREARHRDLRGHRDILQKKLAQAAAAA
jgi:hypothetical protein